MFLYTTNVLDQVLHWVDLVCPVQRLLKKDLTLKAMRNMLCKKVLKERNHSRHHLCEKYEINLPLFLDERHRHPKHTTILPPTIQTPLLWCDTRTDTRRLFHTNNVSTTKCFRNALGHEQCFEHSCCLLLRRYTPRSHAVFFITIAYKRIYSILKCILSGFK